MIAKNYIKFPEALRLQKELFTFCQRNGKITAKFGRLMSVIFKQMADVPQWWKDLKAAELRLIKSWKAALMDLFPKFGESEIKKDEPTSTEPNQIIDLPSCKAIRWQPNLQANQSETAVKHGSGYRSFCRSHQGGYQGMTKRLYANGAYVALPQQQIFF